MSKNIAIVNKKGELLEPTYKKRANGLVKSGRAYWLDDATICLNEMEDFKVSEYENRANGPAPAPGESYAGYEVPPSPYYGYNDEELFKLAKKRVQERNGLIIHVIAYVAVNVFLFFLAWMSGDYWNFLVAGGWGIGVACHIGAYIFNSGPEAIHAEYMKLKGGRYR